MSMKILRKVEKRLLQIAMQVLLTMLCCLRLLVMMIVLPASKLQRRKNLSPLVGRRNFPKAKVCLIM